MINSVKNRFEFTPSDQADLDPARASTSDLITILNKSPSIEVVTELYNRLPKDHISRFQAKEKIDQLKENIEIFQRTGDLTDEVRGTKNLNIALIESFARNHFCLLQSITLENANEEEKESLKKSFKDFIEVLEQKILSCENPQERLIPLLVSLKKTKFIEKIASEISIEARENLSEQERKSVEKFLDFCRATKIDEKLANNFVHYCQKNGTLHLLGQIRKSRLQSSCAAAFSMALKILQNQEIPQDLLSKRIVLELRNTKDFNLLQKLAESLSREKSSEISRLFKENVEQRISVLSKKEGSSQSVERTINFLIRKNIEDISNSVHYLLKDHRPHKTRNIRTIIITALAISTIAAAVFLPPYGMAILAFAFVTVTYLLFRVPEEERKEKIEAFFAILSGKKSIYKKIAKEFSDISDTGLSQADLGLIQRARKLSITRPHLRSSSFKELKKFYEDILERLTSEERNLFKTLLEKNKMPLTLLDQLAANAEFISEVSSITDVIEFMNSGSSEEYPNPSQKQLFLEKFSKNFPSGLE